MANVENIKKAIQVMERVKKYEKTFNRRLFDLSSFQNRHEDPKAHISEEEVVNHCGTTCCFAGWLAVSPEFRDEYWLTPEGYPTGQSGDIVTDLAEILDLSRAIIFTLIYNNYEDTFYGKPDSEVTADDVIEKLKSFI